jgi:hypothetical protein
MKSNGPERMLAKISGMLFALMAAASCTDGTAYPTKADQNQMRAVTRAIFADGRLWLLQDNGSLVSLKPEDSKAEPAMTSGKVVEICKSAGRLTGLVEGQGKWSLQALSNDRWNTMVSVPIQGDTFVALDCSSESGPTTVVTSRRLVELRAGRAHTTTLRQPIQQPLAMGTAFGTSDAVWVGVNVGEWGGGLRRISRSDGTVQTIERNQSGQLCGGPLNTDCDPVNGIVAAPWNSSCVVAAIGFVHMMSHGRIVEVCGNNVRRLYYKALDPQPPRNELDEGEPASTVAFFGLTRSGNTWWAVGLNGLYRFDGVRGPEFSPLPEFENKGGFWVSFDLPGFVLVLTDVNQRRSMSGSVPIMIPR